MLRFTHQSFPQLTLLGFRASPIIRRTFSAVYFAPLEVHVHKQMFSHQGAALEVHLKNIIVNIRMHGNTQLCVCLL